MAQKAAASLAAARPAASANRRLSRHSSEVQPRVAVSSLRVVHGTSSFRDALVSCISQECSATVPQPCGRLRRAFPPYPYRRARSRRRRCWYCWPCPQVRTHAVLCHAGSGARHTACATQAACLPLPAVAPLERYQRAARADLHRVPGAPQLPCHTRVWYQYQRARAPHTRPLPVPVQQPVARPARPPHPTWASRARSLKWSTRSAASCASATTAPPRSGPSHTTAKRPLPTGEPSGALQMERRGGGRPTGRDRLRAGAATARPSRSSLLDPT